MKTIEYYRQNAEEDYLRTPISVLRYITELEQCANQSKQDECDFNCDEDGLYETNVEGADVMCECPDHYPKQVVKPKQIR